VQGGSIYGTTVGCYLGGRRRSLVLGMALILRERPGKGGFARIWHLYGLIFGAGASGVPDSSLGDYHGGIWDCGKLSSGRMAVIRQIVG